MSREARRPTTGVVGPEAPPQTLFTIGYEGSTVRAVTDALRAAGVRLLVDVRAVAASRKPGFSKRLLAAEMAAAGTGYAHLRALGTPKAGRQAARRGDTATMTRIFEAHLATPEATLALADLTRLAAGTSACLLCFERDPACCHRRIVAERVRAAAGLAVFHLIPDAVGQSRPGMSA